MSQVLDALRAQLVALQAQIDAALVQLEAMPNGACPQCGKSERIEETGVMGERCRLTCQVCGHTWIPQQENENG